MSAKQRGGVAADGEARLERDLGRRHRRFGWTSLLAWMLFGLALETFHGFKLAAFLLDPIRREMWTMAHFHGALLAVVNLAYVRWAEAPELSGASRANASRLLIAGSLLLPLGFFLGGLQHWEGDPGLGIFLAPVGGVALVLAVALQTRGAWSKS